MEEQIGTTLTTLAFLHNLQVCIHLCMYMSLSFMTMENLCTTYTCFQIVNVVNLNSFYHKCFFVYVSFTMFNYHGLISTVIGDWWFCHFGSNLVVVVYNVPIKSPYVVSYNFIIVHGIVSKFWYHTSIYFNIWLHDVM